MTVIIQGQRGGSKHDEAGQTSKALQSPVLHRQLNWSPGKVVGGSGNFLCLEDGRKVFDASGGAAVSCLGHGNARVARTMMEQAMTGTPYVASLFWTTNSVEALCRELIDSTKGLMAKAYLVNSGRHLNSVVRPAAARSADEFVRIRGHGVRHEVFETILPREESSRT